MSEGRKIAIAAPSTGEEEWRALREPLLGGWLVQGKQVAAFERAFAERHRVSRAAATSSCTTALHLALLALGVGPGDEVVVPSFSWVASANAVLYCGARPAFVDVDPGSFNLSLDDLPRRLSGNTKAIIAVHLFGLCADVDAIAELAPGIPIVEDAACAAGASYKGRPAGSLGRIAAFSFHPRKSITTGEGGMVTTDDDALADAVCVLRNHGASVSEQQRLQGSRPYLMADFEAVGYNYRMTDLQGAIGLVQLRKLDRLIDERRRWAAYYDRELGALDWLSTPATPADYGHGWQAYVLRVDERRAGKSRNDVMDELARRGVSTRPGTHAIHGLRAYQERLGLRLEDFPGAADCERLSMAIPLHNRMTAEDYSYVVDAVRGAV